MTCRIDLKTSPDVYTNTLLTSSSEILFLAKRLSTNYIKHIRGIHRLSVLTDVLIKLKIEVFIRFSS